jgi:hypothetical protein
MTFLTEKQLSEACAIFGQIKTAKTPFPAGWTVSQQLMFSRLAVTAFDASTKDLLIDYSEWVVDELISCGQWPYSDRTKGFDSAMCHFGILANDTYWISKASEGPEIRLRHLISVRLARLSELIGEPLTWAYVRGIHSQAAFLPDLDDATAQQLRQILSMLATHVRRTEQAEKLPF